MASAQFRSDWELGDPPQGRVEKKDSTKSCLILAIPRTIACQFPLSMEFSRQENWSRLPCPPPGDFPDPGIKVASPTLQVRNQGSFSLYLLLLLLLSRFSRVQLRATPQTAAHQAPPSLGFSRQEHWSGLPFPSPMHESEK